MIWWYSHVSEEELGCQYGEATESEECSSSAHLGGLTGKFASARVDLEEEVVQRVPTAPDTNHDSVIERLNERSRRPSGQADSKCLLSISDNLLVHKYTWNDSLPSLFGTFLSHG